MIAHVRRHPDCAAILVEKTDRLYRNIKDWVALSELGVDVHLVKEGVVLSEDAIPAVTFVHGIKVLMAKNYLDDLSEETRKGMHEKARQGLWPSRAPFGHLNVTRPDGKRVIEPDPEATPLIAQLFELYATGDYPITRLTGEARCLGLVYRKSGKALPRAQIHVMLRNPVYMGEFDWKGVRYRGSHGPLVSRALWENVQELLGRRAPRRRIRWRHEFAFSRLVHCGRCWDEGVRFLLVAERQKRRYVYYRCEECKRRHRAEFVREEVLVEEFGRDADAAVTARYLLSRDDCPDRERIQAALERIGAPPPAWQDAVLAFASAPSVEAWDELMRFTPDDAMYYRTRNTIQTLIALGVDGDVLFRCATRYGSTPDAFELVELGLVDPETIIQRGKDGPATARGIWFGLAARAALIRGDRFRTVRLLRKAVEIADPAFPPLTEVWAIREMADDELNAMLDSAGIPRR